MERELYELHKLGSRLVSIVLPETFEEWRESVAAGYAVATTAEQRAQWGLEPAQDIPNLPQSEIVELVFLAPDDEALDEIQGFNPYANTDITPEEDAGEVVLGPDGEFYVADDGNLVYDDEGNPILDDRFQGGRRKPFSPESSV